MNTVTYDETKYALVPVADLESLAFTDFGRAFWTDGAEAAALRIRAVLAARKGIGDE